MNKFTTELKLDKTPLILQGIDEFLGKLVKITITVIEPEEKKKKKECPEHSRREHSLAGTVKYYTDPFYPAVGNEDWEVMK